MPRAAARSEPAPQPHDALFKFTFSQREHAAGLLRAALPPAWAAKVDFRTVRVESGSFVNRALRRRHSDVVISARMCGVKAYFYVLVEHQREVEPLMVVRMGIYVMRLYEAHMNDHPKAKRVPAILPILVHHSATGWTAATAFQHVIELNEELLADVWRHVPHFEMCVIDLHEEEPENLVPERLTALGKVVLWALSVAGDDARLQQEIVRFGRDLAQVLHGRNARADADAILRYLAATHQSLHRETIGDIVEGAVGPEAREVIVTWVEEIELNAEHKGRAAMGAEILLAQLRARFGTVPASARAKIMAADVETLLQWAPRVMKAASIDDVLAELHKPAKPAARPRATRR